MTQCAAHDAHCAAVLIRNTLFKTMWPIGGVGGLKESTCSAKSIHKQAP